MAAPLQSVSVLAPAKLNLSLDVVGILPGGYHALDMVMQAVNLYEQVTLRRSEDLVLRLPGTRIPTGPKNTAYKAALAFFHYTGLLAGADITIRKTVPVRAGMAGGSADAAAVLVGLNALYGAHLSMTELYDLFTRQVALLREDKPADAAALMPAIEAAYRRAADAIGQL